MQLQAHNAYIGQQWKMFSWIDKKTVNIFRNEVSRMDMKRLIV